MRIIRIKRKFVIATFLFAASFFACSTLVEDMELPFLTPPVIVHAYLYPGMTEINLVLHQARVIGHDDSHYSDDPVRDANVVIISEYGDSLLLEYSDQRRQYNASTEHFPVTAGESYFLLITHPDFDDVKSNTTIPFGHKSFYPVFIDSIDHGYRREFFVDCYIDSISLSSENYFQFFAEVNGTVTCWGEEGANEDVFNRDLFDFSPLIDATIESRITQTGKFSLPKRTFPDTCNFFPQTIDLKLFSMDFHSYQYLESIEEFLDASDNPFVQPQTVYTNITNGYGVFGGYSLVERNFSWDDLLVGP